MMSNTITTAAELEALPGKIVELEFSDGVARECGNCDDCCPCCEVGGARSEGLFVTVKLDDPTARLGAERVTLYRPDLPKAGRVDLSLLCTCGHMRADHGERGDACNLCGASGVGENAVPACFPFESVADALARPVAGVLPGVRHLAEVLHDTLGCTLDGCHCEDKADYYIGDANAILARLGVRSEAEVKAEALREAATDGPIHFAATHRSVGDRGRVVVDPQWLRDRADRLEAEASR